jgi:hypothetical protein
MFCSVFSPGYSDILRQIDFLSWFQASSLSVLIVVDRHGGPISSNSSNHAEGSGSKKPEAVVDTMKHPRVEEDEGDDLVFER